jgi:hypothetical protein
VAWVRVPPHLRGGEEWIPIGPFRRRGSRTVSRSAHIRRDGQLRAIGARLWIVVDRRSGPERIAAT